QKDRRTARIVRQIVGPYFAAVQRSGDRTPTDRANNLRPAFCTERTLGTNHGDCLSVRSEDSLTATKYLALSIVRPRPNIPTIVQIPRRRRRGITDKLSEGLV